MFAGRDTIVAVPAAVRSAVARRSWLLRPPPAAVEHLSTGSAADDWQVDYEEDEDEEEDDSLLVEDTSSDADAAALGHFLPPGVMRLLYFRITAVSPSYLAAPATNGATGASSNPAPYFVIDPRVTQLMQEGSERSRVPYELEYFLTNHHGARVGTLQRYDVPVPSPLRSLHTMRDTFLQMRALFLPSLLSSASGAGSSALPSVSLASSLLLTGPRRSCKRKLASAVACSLGVHYVEANFFTLLTGAGGGDGAAGESAIQQNLARLFERARSNAPCILHLRRMHAFKSWLASMQKEKDVLLSAALGALMEAANAPVQSHTPGMPPTRPPPVVVLGSCESLASLPASLRNLFLHSLSLAPPSLEERRRIVRGVLRADGAGAEGDAAEEEEGDAAAGEDSGKFHVQEMREAAAEVEGIAARSQLTSSPSPPPAAATTAAPSTLLTPAALASLIAQKTAGMNVGELEYFVGSVAKVATERAMRDEHERAAAAALAAQVEQRERERAQRRRAAGQDMSPDNEMEEKKEAVRVDESGIVSLVPASSRSPSPAPATPAAAPSLHLQSRDIDTAVSLYSSRAAALSGTMATLPNVKWSDVGGLENVKKEVMEAIELPLKFPHLFANGVKKRAGILLYGPPGTGTDRAPQRNAIIVPLPPRSTAVFAPAVDWLLIS
jgi:SpoVK/Ycf46/Vps4 family AAA+-type ATPase